MHRFIILTILLISLVHGRLSAQQTDCVNGTALSYECNEINLTARMSLDDFSLAPAFLNDLWGYVDLNTNIEYAIVGLSNGVSVVDLEDPENPVEVAAMGGGFSVHRDIKVYQYFDDAEQRYKAYAYVSSDINEGILILDLNNLANSLSIVGRYFDGADAHNVFISNINYSNGVALEGFEAFLHLPISPSGAAFDIISLTNPISPELISAVGGGGHDIVSFTITDNRTSQCQAGHDPCEIIVNFSGYGLMVEIWDVTEKAIPYLLGSTTYNGASYPHSGWVSEDTKFVFVQDEGDEFDGANTSLRTLDISNLTQPFISNVWQGSTGAVDHNGMVIGNYYYMSNYAKGLTVLDIENSNSPEEVAFFDTFPANNNTSYDGAWGVYPFLPSGNILVSDWSDGLFILNMQLDDVAEPVPQPEDIVTSSGGGGSMSFLMLLCFLALNFKGNVKNLKIWEHIT